MDWSVRVRRASRTFVVGLVALAPLTVTAGAAPASATAPAAAGTAAVDGQGRGAEVAARSAAAASGRNVEITSLRGESSEVYATPGGDLEAIEHLRPVRARVDGGWAAIDNTLSRRADGAVTPKTAAVGMVLSGGGTGPLVRLEQAGRALAFSWPGALPEPVLDGDTATYRSVLPDVDLLVRADTDGFSELLVVRTPQAANDPRLVELRLGVAADGLTVRTTAEGGLQARDAATEGVVFEAPPPLMWDSAGRVAGQQVAVGPGDTTRVAPLGMRVEPGGAGLRLVPDRGLLTDPGTRFPVYIDPQTHTPKAGQWTMVSRYWADAPQWKFNGNSDAGVGYCGWDYCAPYDLKRLFYKFSTSRFAGKTVIHADFVAHETHSASCDARVVQLWRTKDFSNRTTWNNSADDWLDHLDSRDVAHGGGSSCPAGNVEFDATAGVRYAASHGSASTSFGLRAANEDDRYAWKRFSDDAYLRVKYNAPPKQISMSQLTMDPGGSCRKPEKKSYVRIRPRVTANNVTDPDGDRVSVQFQAWWDAGDGKGFAAHWTSGRSTPKKSGSDFSIDLPASIPKNRTIAWYARAVDYDEGQYYSYSPWSGAGSATGCHFVYDTSVPAGPTITSGDYPRSDPEAPDDPWYDGVGRDGTFTIDVPNTDVSKYWFGVNEDPSSDNALVTSGGGAKTVRFRPTRSGLNWVSAQAFDKAGNGSEIRVYQFRVKAGQPPRAQWRFDEATGAAEAAGTAGDRTLFLHGGPTLGTPGVVGTAATFDGVDDYLESEISTVDSSTGFSVSAWAKPSVLPSAAAVVAAQPGNHAPGFELYYSRTYDRWAFNQYSADTAGATPVRVMQAAPGGVRPGEWVHLVGTYSSASDLLSLYVNGALAGTASYTTPWEARRGLQIGAGSYGGAPGSFFPGGVDEVRLFDKPLSAAEVSALAAKQPLGNGRPARAVFGLDEPPAQPDGTPTTQVTGRAEVQPAALRGGAATGAPGVSGAALTLDGVDDYATSGAPHVNNQRSFSVLAWAKLPTAKPAHAAIVATQAGTVKPGFELYYSPSYGWAFNQYTADAADGVPVRAAQGDPARAPGGVWTQVVGSYDAVTDDLRLYVQGAWVATTKFDAPFYGGGPVQIGAGSYNGAPGSFFPGQIDDVQLFDRALSAPEIAELYRSRPLVEGRWKLDAAAGTPAVSPDDVAADQHPLTLGGNAAIDTSGAFIGTGALLLDGSGDYAATAASPVHTDTSFTAAAWVTAPAAPQHPVTVLSQAGASSSGFAVRYVPDPPPAGQSDSTGGRWQLVMADADTAGAGTATAEHSRIQQPNAWNHVAVVYDAFADQMRLYVNGELRQALCADDDDDGTPNDAACTESVSWNSNVTAFDATKGLQLGRTRTGGAWGEYWAGAVDDVWVLQGAATDQQIAALAGGGELATHPGP